MEDVNGVKVVRQHCNRCQCRECAQRKYGMHEKPYVKCPYGADVCIRCEKNAYVEECVFRL